MKLRRADIRIKCNILKPIAKAVNNSFQFLKYLLPRCSLLFWASIYLQMLLKLPETEIDIGKENCEVCCFDFIECVAGMQMSSVFALNPWSVHGVCPIWGKNILCDIITHKQILDFFLFLRNKIQQRKQVIIIVAVSHCTQLTVTVNAVANVLNRTTINILYERTDFCYSESTVR